MKTTRLISAVLSTAVLLVTVGAWSLKLSAQVDRAAAAKTVTPVAAEQLFQQRVQPLLKEKCLACHGDDPKKIKAEYDMRTRAGLVKGGESGVAAIVPGVPEKSPFYAAVTRKDEDFQMPPKANDRLSAEQIEWVRQWIAGGAPWPDEKRMKELAQAPAGKWDADYGVTVQTSGGLKDEWTSRKYKPENLWAYQPLKKPSVPVISNQPSVISGQIPGARSRNGKLITDSLITDYSIRNPIDAFLAAKLPAGLTPAPPADRRTLIRRATFDLLGLPPTPEEVEAFVKDRNPDGQAFARVVERLLASPHYGEQWGRHWLDVVRYADSSGFANDFVRGNTWRYRDYVIRAFNNNKPYDQFIVEQIAGDELALLLAANPKSETRNPKQIQNPNDQKTETQTPGFGNSGLGHSNLFRASDFGFRISSDPPQAELLVAAGFLRMGPWELTGMEVAKVARQRFLDDVTDSVGQVFLAHPLQCARCHDHKFDPIPTRDYYSLQAVFSTTQFVEREAPFLDVENKSGFEESRYLDQRRQEYLAVLKQLDEKSLKAADEWFKQKGIDPAEWNKAVAEAREQEGGGKRREFTGAFGGARNKLLARGIPEDQFPPKLHGFTPEDFGRERVARKGLERLKWEFDRYQPMAFSVYSGRTPDVKAVLAPVRMPKDRMGSGDLEQPAILAGGDPFSPTKPVEPGVLSIIEGMRNADRGVRNEKESATPHSEPGIPNSIEGRRLALAGWIASPQNPLTARVMVNRLWQWHFGQALAGNPNNFGAMGKKPTHPELLDWLAATFVDGSAGGSPAGSGDSPKPWSIKAMHRLIMNSEAYRRSASYPDLKLLAEKDPNGTSCAVFKPRPLAAEELRDAMLRVSGELNPALGGVPIRPEMNLEAAFQPRQVMGTFAEAWQPSPMPEQRHRRSVYALHIRGQRDPFMEVFNEPSPDLSCEGREASTVTPQVFAMFNSQASSDRALAFAARVLKETKSRDAAVMRAFQLAFGRTPKPDELKSCLAHWDTMTARHRTLKFEKPSTPREIVREAVEENTGEKFKFTEPLEAYADFVPDLKPADVDARTRGLAEVCLVLFNSNEFAYLY